MCLLYNASPVYIWVLSPRLSTGYPAVCNCLFVVHLKTRRPQHIDSPLFLYSVSSSEPYMTIVQLCPAAQPDVAAVAGRCNIFPRTFFNLGIQFLWRNLLYKSSFASAIHLQLCGKLVTERTNRNIVCPEGAGQGSRGRLGIPPDFLIGNLGISRQSWSGSVWRLWGPAWLQQAHQGSMLFARNLLMAGNLRTWSLSLFK